VRIAAELREPAPDIRSLDHLGEVRAHRADDRVWRADGQRASASSTAATARGCPRSLQARVASVRPSLARRGASWLRPAAPSPGACRIKSIALRRSAAPAGNPRPRSSESQSCGA
jgi:hypothetical protein